MLYADIVLRQFTGGIEDLFTYAVPKKLEGKLKIGQLVRVPWRQQLLEGIVVALHRQKPSFAVRPVAELLAEEPFLTPQQLELARFIQREYLASLGSVIAAMTPKRRAKNNLLAKESSPASHRPLAQIRLTPAQQRALQQINRSRKPILLFGIAASGKTELYLRLTEATLAQGKGAIILVPEIALTPQTTARFEARFPGQVAVLHSGLSPKARFREWLSLKEERKKIAIGPRSALFAPIQNLGLIVVDEEHDGSYKQESSPRYAARPVAEKLASLTGAKLILGSATPAVESFYRAQKGRYTLVNLPRRIFRRPKLKIFVVDMTNELRSGNRSSLSNLMQLALEEGYRRGEQALLFLNRRGTATLITCQDCGFTLICPNCHLPLIYHRRGAKPHHLLCHHYHHLLLCLSKCTSHHSLL